VLGAQSIYNLVKHICFILIAFLVFSWIEDQILKNRENIARTIGPQTKIKEEKFNYFRSHFRFMRSLTVIITIVLFAINIGMDITDNMHEVDSNHENNVAIGSITTGVAFCLVSILIICLSHLDEPYSEEVTAADETTQNPSLSVENNTNDPENKLPGTVVPEYVPQEYNFGRPQFGGPLQANPNWFQWFNEEVAWSKDMKIRPLTDTSESYRKFQEIYRNIHVSYLMLLLFPMVSLLALVRTERKIVDVHVQLIFFSTIFFAVLDIIQSRVASVLASFHQENSVDSAIGTIKIFVVLAFTLAKLFVFMPAYQLTVVYYTKTDDLAFWLVVPQLVAFIGLSVFDLAYIAGFKFFTKEDNRNDVQSRMVNLRQFLFWVYLGFLCWMLFWI